MSAGCGISADGAWALIRLGHDCSSRLRTSWLLAPKGLVFANIPAFGKDEIFGFDPAKSAVVFDLAELMKTSNLDVDQAMSAPGCMSTPTDADCGPLFGQLGLPFGTTAAGTQAFATLE